MKRIPHPAVEILPTSGRWMLNSLRRIQILTGRGLGLWRVAGYGARVFDNWRECPVVGPDGKLFYLDLGGSGFAQVAQGWSTAAIEPLLRDLPSDGVALDIGANVGEWTRLLAANLARGRVYAFEPSPQTHRCLARNLAGFANVECLGFALSDRDGELSFTAEKHSKLRHIATEKTPNTAKVPCRSLSSWVASAGLKRLDFVKIDVEGFEEDVLLPSADVLRRFKPVVHFEYAPGLAPRSRHQGRELLPFFARLGYAVFRMDKGGGQHAAIDADQDWTNDYVARP